MDFDIPTDLIDKAQIGFREAAGLSNFDRKHTTPPSIPTLEASISPLDPSPSYLICKFCQGKLLRGLQSLICVYCGEYQKKDLHPDPISFNSTRGYTWLLQSLNFNGSERIGSSAEGSGINGGQSPAEDELTLSELLNLKVSVRDVPEKLESSFNIKTSEHNSSLNLDTTDFDSFFTKSKSKSATVSDVHEEQPVASESDQNKIIEDQENLTSDWNAEFQFADTKLENEKPVSADPFEGAEADLDNFFTKSKSKSANVSDVLEQQSAASKADQNKIIEGQEDLTSDWNAEFQFADTKLENKKPVSVDPFEDVKAELSARMDAAFGPTKTLDFKKPDIDSDPFQDDLFGNMGSTTFQQNEQLDSFSGDLNDFNLKDADGDWFSDGNWQKSNIKNTLNDVSLQDNSNNSSMDWFEDTNWQKNSTNNTDTVKDDKLFDIKPNVNDMIPPQKLDLDNSDWFQNSQWVIDGSSSTTNIMVNKDDDDGFGEWNAFTSSTGNQDPVKDSSQDSVQDSWKESGVSEKMSDLNLLQSAVDSQEVDFGNFLQSEVSTGNRNANAEAGNNGEGSKNDEITLNSTTGPKDDVQMLMSQMHDLSFMLKNELSVPSKSDDIGTSHSYRPT